MKKVYATLIFLLSVFGSSVQGTKEDAGGDDHFLSAKSDGENQILSYLSGAGNYGYDLSDSDYTSHPSDIDWSSFCKSLVLNGGSVGKRNFNPWGGKRSVPAAEGYHQLISNYIKKGAGFNPWGGKRQVAIDVDGGSPRSGANAILVKNRQAFNPWGGKRR